ncbi:SLATT domain-containing protein [Aeromonas veronii]|nr:SLATT domain-containing protein [Aeromonas veronii]MBL0642112.1 SLATT domain-containing protein [Aeromonas veronii]
MIEKHIIDTIISRATKTKDACFHASRRLERVNNLALFSLSIIAISMITISIASLLFSKNIYIEKNTLTLQLSQVLISIVALCISILVHKQDYSLRSDIYRRQGVEINNFILNVKAYKELDTHQSIFKTNQYISEYNNILVNALVHHDLDHKITSTSSSSWQYSYYWMCIQLTHYLPWYFIIYTNCYFVYNVMFGIINNNPSLL